MNPPEMVVIVVAIGAIVSIFRAKYGIGSRRQRGERFAGPTDDAEAIRLREEVKQLKERLHVLERIATDNNRATDLDREIERLR